MLPACLLQGLTVVVFPLLGLMADQLRRIKEAGIEGAILKGGMSPEELNSLWQKVKEGRLSMVLTNPEMLSLSAVHEKLRGIPIAHLVLDEAHTLPEWGETFRPAYLELGRIAHLLQADQITAFTATASPEILSRLQTILFEGVSFNLVKANPDRANIYYQVLPTLSKRESLLELVPRVQRPTLIFCASRRETEQVALCLRQELKDREIRFYHAGLSPSNRKELEDWYFHSSKGILTATCAYGMGMDKSNIRTVIHYSLPPSVEAYLQESGRAGRDRKDCQAILLYHPEDCEREKNNPRDDLRVRYEKLLAFAEDSRRCRRESLMAVLEAEPEDCIKCDVCTGQVLKEDPHQEGILKILGGKNLSPSQATDLLLGRFHRNLRLYRVKGFGDFSHWSRKEIEVALAYLKEEKIEPSPQRGIYEGVLLLRKIQILLKKLIKK